MTHAIPYETDELDRAAEAAYTAYTMAAYGHPPSLPFHKCCKERQKIWRKVVRAAISGNAECGTRFVEELFDDIRRDENA